MTTMLAQIQSANPLVLRDVLTILFAFVAAGAGVVAMLNSKKTQRREVTFGEAFVTKEHCGTITTDTVNRIDRLEKSVETMWTTMRAEDESTRAEMRRSWQSIERALGRIEGQLERMGKGSNQA